MATEILTLDNPEYVVFDFDRTLFDVDAFWGKFLEVADEELGVDPLLLDTTHKAEREADEVYDAFEEIEEILGRELGNEDYSSIHNGLISHAADFIIEGSVEAFNNAHATAKVFVLTVGNERFQEFKFGLIEHVLGSQPDDFTCMEGSKAEYIDQIAKEFGADFNKIAYIDDRSSHIDCAADLVDKGLIAIWFDSPAARKNRIEPQPESGLQVSSLDNIIFFEEPFSV